MKLKLGIMAFATILILSCKKEKAEVPTTLVADKTTIFPGGTVNFTVGAETGSTINWNISPDVGTTKQYTVSTSITNAIKFDSIGTYIVSVKADEADNKDRNGHHNSGGHHGGGCHNENDSAFVKITVFK